MKELMNLDADAFTKVKPVIGGRKARRVTIRVNKGGDISLTLTKHLAEEMGGADKAVIATALVKGRGYIRLLFSNEEQGDLHQAKTGSRSQKIFALHEHPFEPNVTHTSIECDFVFMAEARLLTVECPDWVEIFEQAQAEEEGYG